MPRYATKSFEFDAAHRLMDYEGLCNNIHGHRYRAEVVVWSDSGELDHQDMVADFSLLKKIVGGWINDNWDHALILNMNDLVGDVLVDRSDLPEFRIYNIRGNPTAERMAEELFEEISGVLKSVKIRLSTVRIFETPTSMAAYGR